MWIDLNEIEDRSTRLMIVTDPEEGLGETFDSAEHEERYLVAVAELDARNNALPEDDREVFGLETFRALFEETK